MGDDSAELGLTDTIGTVSKSYTLDMGDSSAELGLTDTIGMVS